MTALGVSSRVLSLTTTWLAKAKSKGGYGSSSIQGRRPNQEDRYGGQPVCYRWPTPGLSATSLHVQVSCL